MDKSAWYKMAYYACTVFQPIAYELDLTFNEMALLSCVYALRTYTDGRVLKQGDITYRWMDYSSFLTKYPLTGLTSVRSVIRLVQSAVEKGVLLRETKQTGSFGRKTYFAIPPDLEPLLFSKGQSVDGAEVHDLWLAYKVSHNLKGRELVITMDIDAENEGGDDEGNDPAEPESSPPPILNPPAPAAPLFVDEPVPEFNDGFLAFLKKVKLNTKLTIKLYKEDGGHYSVADRVEQMYLSMLDGTFVEKFQPMTKKYDFDKIGKVKESEIHKALETIPDHIKTLPECFQLWKLKTSYIMESVYVQRFGYVKPAPKATAPVDIPADDDFDFAIGILKKHNGRGWNPDLTSIGLLYQFHVWLKENHDDLLQYNTEMNKLSNYDAVIGRRGIGEIGSAIGEYIMQRGIPSYDDLALNSYWWRGFYLYFYKCRGVRLCFDEALFRKQRERDNDRERLYESRPSDFS